MVQFWHQLGFVVEVPPPIEFRGGLPILVEKERGLIHTRSTVQAPNNLLPPSRVPDLPSNGGNQPITTIESLRSHLQSAIQVELSTIPLYLFGMYSVQIPKEYSNDPRYDDPVIVAVKSEWRGERHILIKIERSATFRCRYGRDAPPESCREYSKSCRRRAYPVRS